ncbi:MAG: CHAD domain-containing protein [Candidatus Binatia bacterium]
MPNEIELKLLIDPQDISRLWRHPLLVAHTRQKLPVQKLLSIYYDTPELTLHENKIAVRLRRVGRRWIQTVKTEGSVVAGLHERPEWEQETAENTLMLQALPDPMLHQFFAEDTVRMALQPVFTTEFSRSRRMLELNGDVIEFSLDRGEIRAGERTQPISEVELELKSGVLGRLFEVAFGLQDTIPLRLENVSKAERGYRLVTGATIASEKASMPTLNPDEAPTAAFVHIAQSCLTHLQANEKGVLSEDEPEFIHQMRVASRRLRSAFSIFADLISTERLVPIREELRWLARELDGARNWDVFVLQTLPPICTAFPDHDGLCWLATQSAELRQQANAQARAAVASARYHKFLLTFGAWLAMDAWRAQNNGNSSEALESSVLDFAARVLQKRHKQLKKRGAHLVTQTPNERHAVRIAAKKLRYAAEFFSSLFPRKRTQRYIDALAALQDILGIMNDSATTVTLMQQLATAESDTLRHQAKGIVLGWAAGKSHAQLNTLETTWSKFLARKTFWS